MWNNEHAPNCPVTIARRRVEADDALTGDIRRGVVIELDAGGDDEAENCTCEACEVTR